MLRQTSVKLAGVVPHRHLEAAWPCRMRPSTMGAVSGEDPKQLVRRGYDALSYRHRADDADDGNYGPWLAALCARTPAAAAVLDLGCGNGLPVARYLAVDHRPGLRPGRRRWSRPVLGPPALIRPGPDRSRHGAEVWAMYTIAAKQARSAMVWYRLPYGGRGGAGRSGSTSAQSSSGTRSSISVVMTPHPARPTAKE